VLANHKTPRILRHFAVIAISLLMVSGCSIKGDVPDFKYPSRTDYSDQNWPELALTEDLMTAGETANADAQKAKTATDAIAARVAHLRARAAALRAASAN